MAKVRVLVVEDSVTVRQRLLEVLRADPEIEVVGEASDGKRAIELCRDLDPDVVTLDMMLPVMSGLAATEYIMAHHPTPILVVSASFNRGELFKTYDALAAGAVDVMEKPRGDEGDGDWEGRFCAAVKLVSRIKVITHPRARLGALGRSSSASMPAGASGAPPAVAIKRASSPSPAKRPRKTELVAIGASTGGPAALVAVLGAIPAGFSIPIVIVLHIDEVFGAAFADWLDSQTHHRVTYPREGDPVVSYRGRVAMAPPGRHLIVRAHRFALVSDPPRHSCRPSIDVLFETIAEDYGSSAAGCILTGMGRDGAAGLLAIRHQGGVAFAQDEASSVVYGMPREATLNGAAERVLPLDQIGAALATLATSDAKGSFDS
jgi:two-component system chemotaxis response regulator CheB